MLKKFFNKPLELKIGEQTLQFNDASDFAFIMEGRTAVSSEKLSELFNQSTDQLETQTKKITKIKDALFAILTHAVEEPDSINRSIRELDSMTFSQDHSWRDIIKGLNECDEEFNSIRTTALSKYIKYLTSLESTIENICVERKQSTGESVADDEKEIQDFAATWASNQMPSMLEPESEKNDEFTRLPKNKEVSIQLPPGREMELRLESHQCKLVAMDDSVQFIDNTGTTILNKGLHIIGRGAKSTVKIDASQKYVSRTHLQINIGDDHTLRLTDLSTSGTFISAEFLM